MNRLHSTGIAVLLLSALLLSGCRSHEADIPEGDTTAAQTESTAPQTEAPTETQPRDDTRTDSDSKTPSRINDIDGVMDFDKTNTAIYSDLILRGYEDAGKLHRLTKSLFRLFQNDTEFSLQIGKTCLYLQKRKNALNLLAMEACGAKHTLETPIDLMQYDKDTDFYIVNAGDGAIVSTDGGMHHWFFSAGEVTENDMTHFAGRKYAIVYTCDDADVIRYRRMPKAYVGATARTLTLNCAGFDGIYYEEGKLTGRFCFPVFRRISTKTMEEVRDTVESTFAEMCRSGKVKLANGIEVSTIEEMFAVNRDTGVGVGQESSALYGIFPPYNDGLDDTWVYCDTIRLEIGGNPLRVTSYLNRTERIGEDQLPTVRLTMVRDSDPENVHYIDLPVSAGYSEPFLFSADVNFDGYSDLLVLLESDRIECYSALHWDPETQTFVYAKGFDEMADFSVDTENHRFLCGFYDCHRTYYYLYDYDPATRTYFAIRSLYISDYPYEGGETEDDDLICEETVRESEMINGEWVTVWESTEYYTYRKDGPTSDRFPQYYTEDGIWAIVTDRWKTFSEDDVVWKKRLDDSRYIFDVVPQNP